MPPSLVAALPQSAVMMPQLASQGLAQHIICANLSTSKQTRRTMTKAQAVSEFKECIGSMYRGDVIMQREAWLNFVDTLCADQLITQRQRDTWSNPV